MTPTCLPGPSAEGDTGRMVMRACVGPRTWTESTVTTGGVLTTTRANSVPVGGPLTVASTVRTGGGDDAVCGAEKPRLDGETMNCCPPVPLLLVSLPSPPPWQPAMKHATNTAHPVRAIADIAAIASSSEVSIFVAEYIDGLRRPMRI